MAAECTATYAADTPLVFVVVCAPPPVTIRYAVFNEHTVPVEAVEAIDVYPFDHEVVLNAPV
jgi:hypothetical protein